MEDAAAAAVAAAPTAAPTAASVAAGAAPTGGSAPVAAAAAGAVLPPTLPLAAAAGGGSVEGGAAGGARATESWDPFSDAPYLAGGGGGTKPTPNAMRRLERDLRGIMTEPLPGILVVPDDDVMGRVHALVTGPDDTPYEGGLFYFVLQTPPDYPNAPPKVRLQNTGGVVRFGPNLYANGKVCLSILGTWSGPCWSPALTLSSVLLSIQSLMSAHPLRNEPGLEAVAGSRLEAYDAYVRHATMEHAVLGVLRNRASMPPPLFTAAAVTFVTMVDVYEARCDAYAAADGAPYEDMLGGAKGTQRWRAMHDALRPLAEALQPLVDAAGGDDAA